MKKGSFIFAAAVTGALLLGACKANPIYNVVDQPVVVSASSYTLKDVRKAIIRAGSRRGWTFTDEGSNKLVGRIDLRGRHTAVIDVDYNKEDFDITYRDSQGLKHNAEQGTIHKNYNNWIHNLTNDIMTELSLL